MRKIQLIFVIFLVISCASPTINDKTFSLFVGSDITISYNNNGDFESLASKAVAKVNSNTPNGRDEAVTIATVRARRNIAEFINTDVQSERFIETVSSNDNKSDLSSVSSKAKDHSKIAYKVRESILQKSNAILRGTYVESEIFDEGEKSVIVIVRAGNKGSASASDLRKIMGK